jgi:two-component system response regulator YesN
MIGILIADDEEATIHTLKLMIPWESLHLELRGVATDGKELYQMIETTKAQIVLTDIVMPQMTGLEVAEKISRQYPEIHFILMSAYADFQYARSALKLGLDDLLPKPIIRSELNDALIRACRSLEGVSDLSPAETDPVIQKVQEYVLVHYSERISFAMVADSVYMNPSYFSRFFKQKTGMNFSEYLTDVRIDAAKRLLRQGEYNINEIAEMTGFGSAKYFSGIFRKKTGQSPSEYRRK